MFDVKNDHNYCLIEERDKHGAENLEQFCEDIDEEEENIAISEQSSSQSTSSEHSWSTPSQSQTLSVNDDYDLDDITEEYIFVSKSNLLKLLKKCQHEGCTSLVEQTSITTKGAQVTIKSCCLNEPFETSDHINILDRRLKLL